MILTSLLLTKDPVFWKNWFMNYLLLFSRKLTEIHIKSKVIEQTQVISNYNVFVYIQVFYILLCTYVSGEAKNVLNVAKSRHIETLVFLSLCLSFYHYIVLKCLQLLFHSSMIWSSLAFIARAFKFSTFYFVVKIHRLLHIIVPATFILYHGKYYISVNNNYLQLDKIYLFIKLFTVHKNYLLLIKVFTIINDYLPLLKLFIVNNNCLPLIEVFTVTIVIYG